jgi:hypothetical protein
VIAHVILFAPKPGLTDADRERIVADLAAAASGIPSIRRVRLGRRVRHGLPGYEQAMREPFEYLVIVECDHLDDLKGYLAHPLHGAIGQHFSQSSTAALAYDYEVMDF